MRNWNKIKKESTVRLWDQKNTRSGAHFSYLITRSNDLRESITYIYSSSVTRAIYEFLSYVAISEQNGRRSKTLLLRQFAQHNDFCIGDRISLCYGLWCIWSKNCDQLEEEELGKKLTKLSFWNWFLVINYIINILIN